MSEDDFANMESGCAVVSEQGGIRCEGVLVAVQRCKDLSSGDACLVWQRALAGRRGYWIDRLAYGRLVTANRNSPAQPPSAGMVPDPLLGP